MEIGEAGMGSGRQYHGVMKTRAMMRAVGVAAVAALMLGSGGCGGARFPGRGVESAGSQRVVAGDFDDVDAAVDVACSASELAIVTKATDEDGTRRFEMVTVGDELAWATAREVVGSGGIEVRVRIRADGDAAWEKAFLDAVQKRLGQLRGPNAAPVRGFGTFDTK